MKGFTLFCGLCFLLMAGSGQSVAQQQPGAQQKSQNAVYENEYMRVALQPGWTAKKARRISSTVNIVKGNYILYINTQASQASGVEGGRFSEIGMGAPSVDAVVTEQPRPPCGKAESTPAFGPHTRVDLYVSKADSKPDEGCNAPSSGTVWYFSYLTDASGGYFNFYVPGQNRALVVTMAYAAKDVNSLPAKGSQELNAMLSEMTAMVKSLKIKRK